MYRGFIDKPLAALKSIGSALRTRYWKRSYRERSKTAMLAAHQRGKPSADAEMGRVFRAVKILAVRWLPVWHHFVPVLFAGLFLVLLQWHNDGLWSEGDAPHHAANGIFWKDFLLSGSLNPRDYALRYYARYPVINPVNYPPLFYLLEAACFGVFHPSAYLAKGLVLVFALIAALYLMAWLRRWVAAEAGWAACLLLMMPGFVRWSHAVMLNVPATSLSLAALYHARRWLEAAPGPQARRQFCFSVALSLAATLTYYPAGMVVLVILAWRLAIHGTTRLMNRKVLMTCLAIVLLLIPLLSMVVRWAPVHFGFVTRSITEALSPAAWIFYAKQLPELTGPFLLAVASLGAAIGIARRPWRRETMMLLLFFLVHYASLSVLAARESRYAMLLCMPIVCFFSFTMLLSAKWIGNRFGGGSKRFGVALGVIALAFCGVQARTAAKTNVPSVEGVREVAAYIRQIAPGEPVFYDGSYNGVFTFYVQAGDPHFRQRVVLGSKLLYASALHPQWRYQAFVSSRDDVIRRLQLLGGSRWIAIETSKLPPLSPAAGLLRETIKGPEFELTRSFPAAGYNLNRIDVYRFKLDPAPVEEVELPFPILGEGVRFRARPIQR